jgi:hypothetical protein
MTNEDIIKTVKELLSFKKSTETALAEEVKLEQVALDNGTVIEADALEAGAPVFVVSDEDRVPLPAGDYKLEDGRTLVVAEEGVIESIGEAEAAEDAATEEDMDSDTSEFVTKADFDTAIADIKALLAKDEAVEVEASADETPEVAETVAEVVTVEASVEPAATPIKTNPEKETERQNMSHLFNGGTSGTPADLVRNAYQKLYKSKKG